ncbi:MAG TPA: hypothetical protein DEP38_22550 [Cyanobacteria bacterium UBA9226]|nr:hypothetical protein [Cyanobacteria bacterium UBA9226]
MNYCINYKCLYFHEISAQSACPYCGPKVLLQGRYRVVKRLSKGGFGAVFEVEDITDSSKKVLKVLTTEYDKAIALFQRESEVLKQLKHPGIPKVESDGYFTLYPPQTKTPIHCLVMEKIEGMNLKEWLCHRQNQPITQTQAIFWLKQLVEILQLLHERQYCHRDIKPSNIMIKPDNQLVLIDFGAVREVTETYLLRVNGQDGTAIISPGYTPPEQAMGKAIPQSDFYALGRTFVHLLTGIHPTDFPINSTTDRLDWRNKSPNINKYFADVIDKMMANSAINRPANPREIDRILNKIGKFPILRIGIIAGVTAIIIPVVGVIISKMTKSPQACDLTRGDNLSCGEEALIPGSEGSFKQKGIEAFSENKYDEAVNFLTKARAKYPSDPEILIYLNNAKLANQKAYTIAVIAPIGKSSDTALEILRGVAQSQEEINQGKKINGMGLRVSIADDANQGQQAKEIANKLVLRKDILAVIGNYASEVTLEAVPIYQNHQLVAISPGSTSEQLSAWGNMENHVFFRTISNTSVESQYLVNEISSKLNQKKAAIFYVPQSSFSQSIQADFTKRFGDIGGKVVTKFDLSSSVFNASASIAEAQKLGANILVVFPDGGTSTYGIPNTLKLVKANRGRHWVIGSSTLYSSETLELLREDALNRFVIVVAWHYLDTPNRDFPQAAKKLWGGNVSWRTATSYDATRVLISALEKQKTPTRQGVQKVLADPNFQTEGATGKISFAGGNRQESIAKLVKVVRSNCAPESYKFVPVWYGEEHRKNLEKCANQ